MLRKVGAQQDSLAIGSIVVPFGGSPCRILNINRKKELLCSLWVVWFELKMNSLFYPLRDCIE